MSLTAKVIDYYDDFDRSYLSKIAMPGSLVGTSMRELSSGEHGSLPDSSFGLVVMTKTANVLRRFPVNDPGNAWLSAQYFQRTHEKLAFPARLIAAKYIKEACHAYEVPSSHAVDAYYGHPRGGEKVACNMFREGSEIAWSLRSEAPLTKCASADYVVAGDDVMNLPDDQFALILPQPDGTVMRKYAMPDDAHVKKAAAYFDKYAMQFSSAHRHKFALSVGRRATELGTDVSQYDGIQKWGSERMNPYIDYHIEQRKSLLPMNPDACATLDKLASEMSGSDTRTAAEALSVFDQVTGLDRYYDRGIVDPYMSVMDKHGSAWSEEVDGVTLTGDHLKKVASGKKLGQYLGKSFASQFKKNAESMFGELSDPHKVLIKQIAFGEA